MSAPFVLLPGNARWVCTLVVCALLGNSTAAPPARFTLRPEAAFHPKRLLIKPRQAPAGATVASQLAVVHQAQGIQVRRKFAALGGLELLELPAAGDMAATVESYRASGLVEYAEPDYQVRIAKSPNDPAYQFGSLWAWHNTGQSLGVDDADIDAPEGWDRRTDASSIIVAVIDTGIRTTHEDLKGNLWTNPGEIPGNGRDDDLDGFIDDLYGINAITRSGNPSDDHGHGTHVAGIIGAVGDNGRGVVGVAWRVKLMALKFLDAAGNGYESDAITCIDYARAHGAKVINCSWGGGGFSQALADAVQSAAAAGIVIVAAAGNGSSDNDVAPFYPASYGSGNVLAVAATTRWDDLASFSNFGQGSVAVGAPGVEIFSTSYYGDSSYMPLSGTSMAAPVVSGILALMRAEFSGETPLQLFNRLLGAVDPIPALQGKCSTGGRVNLRGALASTSSRPANDDFAHRTQLTLPSFRTRGINVDATLEPGEPGHPTHAGGRSIWWGWRGPEAGVLTLDPAGSSFEPLLAVYRGSALASLERVAWNDPDAGRDQLMLPTEAGVDYFIAVDGRDGATGTALLKSTFSPRPVNDTFARRLEIGSAFATVTGTNVDATVEEGEPLHAGQPGGRSVWWSWTPVRSGEASITTAGSEFDTLLAVYTGNDVAQLTLVAANDDDPAAGDTTSRVDFFATAGTRYAIAVDGVAAAAGRITLNTPPLNDDFAHRVTLSGINCVAIGFNLMATREPSERALSLNAAGKTIWWTWTAPISGRFNLSTVGSSFDTVLGVFTGTDASNLSQVAVNDNDPYGSGTSLVSFEAEAGEIYAILVDGVGAGSGTVRLTIGNTAYTITELPPGGGYWGSAATGINAAGHVAGYCLGPPPSYPYQACIWKNGADAPQLICTDATESLAWDINNQGQVVGYLTRPGHSQVAFLWQDGVTTELADQFGSLWSVANAIDDDGHVVGWLFTRAGQFHAFLWHNGMMTDLGAFGAGRSLAYDLNGPNFIVGYAQDASASNLGPPLIWRDGRIETIATPFGSYDAGAASVNALGQVVGKYFDGWAPYMHGFLWEDGVLTDLGLGDLTSINNLSQAVGWDRGTTGLLWSDHERIPLKELLPPNVNGEPWLPMAISDWGQIVGGGTFEGKTQAFLMTPLVPPQPRAILLSPANHESFEAYADIALNARIVAANHLVTAVNYFEGGRLIGSVAAAPYTFHWRPKPGRGYDLTARAVLSSGDGAFSPCVHVTVAPSSVADSDEDGLPDSWEIAQGLNPNDPQDALCDHHGDGCPNLLRYALGNSATTAVADTSPVQATIVAESSRDYLSIQFRRRRNAPWLQYIPEVSGDMAAWTSDSAHVRIISTAPLDEEWEVVTVRDGLPAVVGAPRFFRVRIVPP